MSARGINSQNLSHKGSAIYVIAIIFHRCPEIYKSRNNIIGLCKLKLPHDCYPRRWMGDENNTFVPARVCTFCKKAEHSCYPRALFPASHQTAQIQLKGKF